MNEISLLFYFIPGVQIVGTVQRKAEEKKALGAGREGQAPTPPPPPPHHHHHLSDPEGAED